MRGKAKIVRKEDGRYYAYVRNYWFQRWKPLTYQAGGEKQISFKDFKEFSEITKIDCFDIITISYDKYSGMKRN